MRVSSAFFFIATANHRVGTLMSLWYHSLLGSDCSLVLCFSWKTRTSLAGKCKWKFLVTSGVPESQFSSHLFPRKLC